MAGESQDGLTAGAESGRSADALEQAEGPSDSDSAPELSGDGSSDRGAEGDSRNRKVSSPRWKRPVIPAAVVVVLLAGALVLPPLVNISRYQRQITALMTRSMGRPVRMSAVEMRLLPSPGFVLHDLAVSEDPAFGAEPILFARTVVASVRVFSLWRGRLEISQVSVDEASLNLVRSEQGGWNLESLLLGSQAGVAGGSGTGAGVTGAGVTGVGVRVPARFPYLQATNSRVNFKNGAEKSPFSLAGTDFSLSQDTPGQWRVRLLGEPVRTDMPMSLADTGEVRMEASLQSAAQLREMPIKLQMEWRDAQLGQLSRLLLGRDAGWRGDLTADIEVQGTPDSAQTKARLRATGVRREEFVPETSLDFDANCSFRYQHSQVAFHDVGCDTAIGDGRLHLKAEVPGRAAGGGKTDSPEALLEVRQVPVQAALDLLRTVRSGFAPGISAKGIVNGSLHYKEGQSSGVQEASRPSLPILPRPRRGAATARPNAAPGSLGGRLQGTLTITGAELSGGKLQTPLKLPEVTLIPAEVRQIAGTGVQSRAKLVGLFTVPLTEAAQTTSATRQSADAGPADGTPVSRPVANVQLANVQLFLDERGYQAQVTGNAPIGRLRELAYGFGWPASPAADGFHGGTADFTLAGQGAWVADASGNDALPADATLPAVATELTLHSTEWQAEYLAQPVKLAQATVRWSATGLRFEGDFAYGGGRDLGKDAGVDSGRNLKQDSAPDAAKEPVKDALRGSVVVDFTTDCVAAEAATVQTGQAKAGADVALDEAGSVCLPHVQLRFGVLDAASVEAALEAQPEVKSVFAPLTDRIRSASSGQPKMPEAVIGAQADSLVLGLVTLQKPAIHLRSKVSELEIADWETAALGGSAKGKGSVVWDGGKPEYSLEGSFTRLSGSAVATLLDSRWSGGTLDGGGKVALSGLTPRDLLSTAVGDLRFDWRNGAILVSPAGQAAGQATGPTLESETHFEDWSGAATIGTGKLEVSESTLNVGRKHSSIDGTIAFAGPAKLTQTAPDSAAGGARKSKTSSRK